MCVYRNEKGPKTIQTRKKPDLGWIFAGFKKTPLFPVAIHTPAKFDMIECTLANESATCAYPKVCYEVFNHTTSTHELVSSHCGCLSNFGYAGDNCDERTPSSEAIMAYYLLMSILPTLFWVWALYRLLPKIISQFRTGTSTTMTSSAVLCLVGMFVYCFYIPFLCYQAVSGVVSLREHDGIRVQAMYDIVFHIMFVRIFLYEVNFIYISLAWYQVAWRSNNLKSIARRQRNRTMEFVCATVCAVLLTVMVVMFAEGLQSELYMFWGVTAAVCLAFWVLGALYITKTLEHMNASNTFSDTLRKIRQTSLYAGCGLFLSSVGMFVQTTRGIPGHEPLPLSSCPPWLIGHVLSVSSVPLTYAFLLWFHVHLGSKTRSSSSSRAQAATSGNAVASPSNTNHRFPSSKLTSFLHPSATAAAATAAESSKISNMATVVDSSVQE